MAANQRVYDFFLLWTNLINIIQFWKIQIIWLTQRPVFVAMRDNYDDFTAHVIK